MKMGYLFDGARSGGQPSVNSYFVDCFKRLIWSPCNNGDANFPTVPSNDPTPVLTDTGISSYLYNWVFLHRILGTPKPVRRSHRRKHYQIEQPTLPFH